MRQACQFILVIPLHSALGTAVHLCAGEAIGLPSAEGIYFDWHREGCGTSGWVVRACGHYVFSTRIFLSVRLGVLRRRGKKGWPVCWPIVLFLDFSSLILSLRALPVVRSRCGGFLSTPGRLAPAATTHVYGGKVVSNHSRLQLRMSDLPYTGRQNLVPHECPAGPPTIG